ncbi:MAG: twin-arginine translocase subunit TatC [Nitrososphaerota archaeon]|nr:twin-arginine translocase subunit TatC [Nitrososphaerota archaeon]
MIFYNAFQVTSMVSLSDFVSMLILIPMVTSLGFAFPVFILPSVELKILNSKQFGSVRKCVYILVALAVGLVNPDPIFTSSIFNYHSNLRSVRSDDVYHEED